MAIPDFQTLMLPVLARLNGTVAGTPDLIAAICGEFALTPEERAQRLPSGRQATIANRVHWALAYLGKAGLIRRVSRGHYVATAEGIAVLAAPPARITIQWLSRIPAFAAFRAQAGRQTTKEDRAGLAAPDATEAAPTLDPEEAFERAVAELDATLAADLLEAVRAMPAADFERLIIILLRRLGFGGTQEGAARQLGRGGDGGVDGVISEDALGLDVLYIQAKRYAADNTVGSGALREFAGALLAHGAKKGVFATTSSFSAAARKEAERLATNQRIVLLDGDDLSRLMRDYDVGVRTMQVVKRRKVDLSAFSEDSGLD